MKFVCVSSIPQRTQEVAGEIFQYDGIKLLPRAGITCCFLNGRGFNSIHEIGISLIYVYISLVLDTSLLRSIALTILVSFIFTVCMHLSLQAKRSRVAILLSMIFSIWDLFLAINLSENRLLPYLFGVSLFSTCILFILYIDGRKRPGIKQCMFKDMALVGFFILKYGKVRNYTVYPYIVSAVIIMLSVKEFIEDKKTRKDPGEEVSESNTSREEERQRRPVRKASVRAGMQKKEDLPKKDISTVDKKTEKTKHTQEKRQKDTKKQSTKKKEEIERIEEATNTKTRIIRAAAREARGK